MKITKRKAKGVLADMLANMDEDSLSRTREKMERITEDYCSYDVAKLLKEKGFIEMCYMFYSPDIHGDKRCGESYENHNNIDGQVSCPTHQLACKWLREVHKIDIFIDTDYPINKMKYTYRVVRVYKDNDKLTDVWGGSYDTYEEATEAALVWVLDNLI